jgi:hypothetical protein
MVTVPIYSIFPAAVPTAAKTAYAVNGGKRSIAQNPLRISDAGDSIMKGSRMYGRIGIHPPGIEAILTRRVRARIQRPRIDGVLSRP